MKFFSKRIVMLFIICSSAVYSYAQNNFFADATESSFKYPAQKRAIIPSKYRTVKLSSAGILSFFISLPAEKNITNRNNAPILDIPMPDGKSARFRVWESSVMEPALAADNPNIKTFTGQGIDDPTATIKLDWTEFGFHAMILSPATGAVFIDPYDRQTITNYISYYKVDYKKNQPFSELPPIKYPGNEASRPNAVNSVLAASCIGSQLRTYRLAIACTHQYATAATGLDNPTKAQVLAKIVTSANRVNGIYEKELSIRMILIAAESDVIFPDAATDPFTGNDNASILINESQSIIDAHIPNANYDIGHTFSTGGGGLAGLGVVCRQGQKGSGITGSPNPVGDAYDVDYVAHEMGHQFGGSHTFNSDLAGTSCEGNGSRTTNSEPGSGTTIMAYAGICGSDDMQSHSDPQFQAISFNEITAYTISGAGSTCAVVTTTGNTAPVVNAGADYTIPKSTPFSLSGSATDANGDALTFSWEQIDVGGPFGTWNTPSGNAPLFRSFVPKSTPVRFFPKVTDVINNVTSKGEVLPSYNRVMHFRLTARDNRAGGGGVCFDEDAITVTANAGPFLVTYPNTTGITWIANDFKTVTWDPAGTAAAPVSCSNVKIELSTDGGLTFPITILESTPNDGTEEIQVPNNITTTARIRITSVGNIFYDISNANFSIQNAPTSEFAFNNPVGSSICSANSIAAGLKTGSLNGFSTAINLSATGNPAGTTVTFGTNPILPGGSTNITLNNTAALAGGTYNITVTGIAGSVSKTRIIPFVVNKVPTAPTSLIAPENAATGISILPTFKWTVIPGAGTYRLEISKTSNFTPIEQTVSNIDSVPVTLTSPLTENTVYYWRVITTNSCGVSPSSGTGIFKTGIFTCKNSTDVPKAISEIDTPTIKSIITIPAAAGVIITDLNVVGLTGTHSYTNDLTVSLTSPAGTTVVLFNAICPGGQPDFSLNLDDEATIEIPCPATGNKTARPQHPLSAFDGENSAGVWTLTVKDNYDGDGGSLNSWGLTINDCAVISTAISSQLCPPAASTSFTSDITGTTYQWQVDPGTGFVNLANNANYAGVTTVTLQITNAPTSWTGYQYRCVVGTTNSSVSAIGFASYWKGTVSNAWENAANWSCNSVPDANTDVFISSGTAVVKSNALCRSIQVSPGSSVTVNTGFKITVTH